MNGPGADAASSRGGGRQITRTISVPSSVSPEAQAFLAADPFHGGEGAALPALDDAEGWRSYVRSVDALLLETIAGGDVERGLEVDQREVEGVPVFVLVPQSAADEPDAPIYLDIHGGGLVLGAGACCRAMAALSARRTGMATWAVDYRMPPDHPFPAALDDCLAVYGHLLGRHGPERLCVGGGSAGGNLAAALMLRARDEGLELPGALVLLSPEVDLTESGDSFQTNLGVDTVLTTSLAPQNALYADGHDLADPYISPLFGDFAPGFPPTLLQSGTRDLFLSNTVRMHRRLRAAGIEAELHIFEAMPHGGFLDAPEDHELAKEMRSFLEAHLS